jgi:hypothetical protein
VARANARQNIADSHQRLALAGLQKELVTLKVKLRNNQPLTDEEESMYITHFSAIVRARQNQFYQHSIGMLDEEEWDSMVSSLKTLLSNEKIQFTFKYSSFITIFYCSNKIRFRKSPLFQL